MLKRLATPLALILGATIPAAALYAADDIDQVRTVDPAGIVSIHNPRGDLEVRVWDRDEVKVSGEVDDLAEAVQFEVSGKRTLIHVRVPKRNTNWGDGSDLVVRIPKSSGLVIDAVSADIDVSGVTGALMIRTVGGDVEVDGIGSRTRIRTVSGDVEVTDGTGRLSVASTSGDLDIDVQADTVYVDTMNGDIDLRLGGFDSLDAQTVRGALEVAGLLNRNGRLQAKTVNSRIELELEQPVNARISATTFARGEIRNRLTDDRPNRAGDGLRLNTVAGDGSAEIVLRSVKGGIEID